MMRSQIDGKATDDNARTPFFSFLYSMPNSCGYYTALQTTAQTLKANRCEKNNIF